MRLWIALAVCTVGHAQPPAIRQNGVFNSASRIPSGLTGSSLARRSRFTIEGIRLANPAAETRIRLLHGDRSILLPVISAEPRRIDAWLPARVPPGPASLSVETSAGESLQFPVTVVSKDAGLYTANQKGWGPAKIESTRGAPDSPAHSGDIVELSATGFGDSDTVKVTVGGRTVPGHVTHGDRGLDRLRFRIPADAPEGCFVPVYAAAAQSNVVTIAIGASSGCAMPRGWPTPADRGRSSGILGVARSSTQFALNQPIITNDEAFAAFFANGWPTDPSAVILAPPRGLCTAYSAIYGASADFESIAAVLTHLGGNPSLDAGRGLTIAGTGDARSIPQSGALAGEYWTRLGFEDTSRRRTLPLFLNDPQYRITVPGGKQVNTFSEIVPGIPRLEWTNRDALSTVERSRPLRLTWTGAPADATMLIVAASFDAASTAGQVCYCAAASEAGGFEIPSQMFARFPATGTAPGPARGGVMLIAIHVRQMTAKVPRGLDVLRTVSVSVVRRRVEFR
jgi:uncharacterized protein (TIGR03437 family)